MSMNEARDRFLEGQKRYSELLEKKKKLEIRQSEMREKLQGLELACVENLAEKERLTQSFALGELTQKQFDQATKGIIGVESERNQAAELTAAVSQCLTDCGNSLTAVHQENNELSCRFYLALCDELTREIRPKIPKMALQMLAYARLRSGRVYGREGWTNLLVDLFGNGRDTAEDLKNIENEIKKTYGI
jgi:phage-related minor tail protein